MRRCKARKNFKSEAYRQIRRTIRFAAQTQQMSVFQQPVAHPGKNGALAGIIASASSEPLFRRQADNPIIEFIVQGTAPLPCENTLVTGAVNGADRLPIGVKPIHHGAP